MDNNNIPMTTPLANSTRITCLTESKEIISTTVISTTSSNTSSKTFPLKNVSFKEEKMECKNSSSSIHDKENINNDASKDSAVSLLSISSTDSATYSISILTASTSSNIASTSSNIASTSSNIASTSSNIAPTSSNIAPTSPNIASTSPNIASTSFNIPTKTVGTNKTVVRRKSCPANPSSDVHVETILKNINMVKYSQKFKKIDLEKFKNLRELDLNAFGITRPSELKVFKAAIKSLKNSEYF